MYTSFSTYNFRGFRSLSVGPLDRINLIAGKNNAGKTALLEALWLHHGPDHPESATAIDQFRGLTDLEPSEFLLDLFHNFDRNTVIQFVANGTWGKGTRQLHISLTPRTTRELPLPSQSPSESSLPSASSAVPASNDELVFSYINETNRKSTTKAWLAQTQLAPNISGLSIQTSGERLPQRPVGIFLSSRRISNQTDDAQRFGQLERSRKERDILDALHEIEPNLSRLTVIPIQNRPVVFGDIGLERLVPIALLGDGMNRLMSLAIAIASFPGGMVLIDEIENGLHHGIMNRVWKTIGTLARRYDVQIVATTHSWECIKAAHEAFGEMEVYDFRLHRLDRMDYDVRVTTYDRETLDAALAAEMEVR